MTLTLITPATVEEARAYVHAEYGHVMSTLEVLLPNGRGTRTVEFEDGTWLCSDITADAPAVESDAWYIDHATYYLLPEGQEWDGKLLDYPIVTPLG